nr:tRNA uridine-5-carboxymethylaminomethyl(34) synthesis enzyme MnmG [Desulfobacterales bacterium]
SQAYMAVLVDDLVTRGTREPYRMFTSRAEYRLILREDNADLRLMETGHELGLIDRDAVKDMRARRRQIDDEIKRVKKTVVKPLPAVNAYLRRKGTRELDQGVRMDRLLKRSELKYAAVRQLAPAAAPIHPEAERQVEIEIKYEGYIERQNREAAKLQDLEDVRIPAVMDYQGAHGLSNELKEKLTAVRPTTLAQASRIPGMTPAALSILMILLKAAQRK